MKYASSIRLPSPTWVRWDRKSSMVSYRPAVRVLAVVRAGFSRGNSLAYVCQELTGRQIGLPWLWVYDPQKGLARVFPLTNPGISSSTSPTGPLLQPWSLDFSTGAMGKMSDRTPGGSGISWTDGEPRSLQSGPHRPTAPAHPTSPDACGLLHSYRKATIGSTRVALRAGT